MLTMTMTIMITTMINMVRTMIMTMKFMKMIMKISNVKICKHYYDNPDKHDGHHYLDDNDGKIMTMIRTLRRIIIIIMIIIMMKYQQNNISYPEVAYCAQDW